MTIDLLDSKDWKKEIKDLVNEENIETALLLPSTSTVYRAIEIAKENAELPKEQRLQQFLGSGVLYGNDVLSNRLNKQLLGGLI